MDDSAQKLTPQAAADDQAQITAQPVEDLADVVADQEEAQADFQAAYNAGGSFKERLEEIASAWHKGPEVQNKTHEINALEEVQTNPELKEPELQGYIKNAETEVESAVIDPSTGQAIMQSVAPKNPQITLPLTDDQIQVGLQHKVFDAIRWLAEWCVRQLKKMHKTAKLST